MTDSLPAAAPLARALSGTPPASGPGQADLALGAALGAAPLAVGSLAIALASAIILSQASPWRVGWAIAAGIAVAAMTAAMLAARSLRTPREVSRRLPLGYAALGIFAMALMAIGPWLPGPAAGANAGSLFVVALGTAAVGAAAAFASLRAPAALAAAMPLSPAAADWWSAEENALSADALAGALIGAVALAVSIACRRHWRRDLGAALAGDARIRALEADRDAARHADRESRRVLAMASRDLRQPVNALGLFAAALEQRLRSSGDELLVNNLVRSVDGLDRSLGAMLDLTRIDAATPSVERVALADVFRRLATRFAPDAEEAGLRLRFAAGAKAAVADAQLLERLLAHLVQDALRRTAQGGVSVVARRAGGRLHIEVWDTGAGLAEGLLDPGPQSTAPALALAIVERLAQRLDVRVGSATRPGKGSRVRFALPAAADDAAVPELVPSSRHADATLGH